MVKKTIKLIALVLTIAISISCTKKTDGKLNTPTKAGIFKLINTSTLEMNGVIDSKSLKHFNSIYEANSNIKTINIVNCDGSKDDETNLKLSKRVYDLSINTHLLDNASIASGGVDFFLAGKKRTRGNNTKVGVHAWSGGEETATDFPVGHAEHQKYIDYYKSVGFSDADAKAFYYFTINAAPAEAIHWMTEAELTTYKIFN